MAAGTLCGVRLAGCGSAVPDKRLTNDDLVGMMDTSDEWIRKRTGILERRIVDSDKGEGQFSLATDALRKALDNAGMAGGDLDLIIHASVTSEMRCPSNACRISAALDAQPAGAFDIVAACSGFVYAINLADSLVRSGRFGSIGVIGCDAMTTAIDYNDRSVAILFGDAAGAAVLVQDEDPTRGCLHQVMEADGRTWPSLYIPNVPQDIPEDVIDSGMRMGTLRMDGREVYKFAVKKFKDVIEESLEAAGLTVDDIAQFVCHQSNVRIIESAKEKLGLPDEKVYINIDHYGNSSAGSVGLCLDQLWQAGKITEGDIIVMVAFGGGMTWSSSVWRV
ncbi:MAG: beta-ketoacyl-ACP synthase III [Phycisphaerales bacterium]|jgi:3-oxoacyl-[acyl-carrier-protein] synthase-3|nr:beta-ketoacyl-ACP synthase III [Phycisphaerales bacterium]MDP6311448.1 beta-ketoacyl-ACP synthase III [Phycisphaerales bacterium]MDP7087277.1 beta-ketoacyl-ACP synthase III [Phycisphaerales bacterium]MDP7188945.1 beta-ketoacyl-ACP synthase III [Phycisphaerales bacterium]MDP7519230.1 beta-ketoacyl-ACP synthase III [Phycisphaerales bacterium]|tara:strand:- start:1513 stop:2517 length:1005 start_codon:yes stop_codon:yes gene_type:complete